MIYLASPYTHYQPQIRNSRFQAALRYTHLQMQMGNLIFSPIVYGHSFSTLDSNLIPFEAWTDFNDQMLLLASNIHILTLEGWKESRGISYEIGKALENSIPVSYVEPLK